MEASLESAAKKLGSISTPKKRKASRKNGHAPKRKAVEQHAPPTQADLAALADEIKKQDGPSGKFIVSKEVREAIFGGEKSKKVERGSRKAKAKV
jgi:hypothetical protein